MRVYHVSISSFIFSLSVLLKLTKHLFLIKKGYLEISVLACLEYILHNIVRVKS